MKPKLKKWKAVRWFHFFTTGEIAGFCLGHKYKCIWCGRGQDACLFGESETRKVRMEEI